MAQNNNSNQNSNMPKLADMAYVYAKMKWMQGFRAFSLEGHFVKLLLYASMLENNEENQRKLQEVADEYHSAGWQFQLRNPSNNKVVFETQLAA